MRRSCAPSIGGKSIKRAKFCSPFLSDAIRPSTQVTKASETSDSIAEKFGLSLSDKKNDVHCILEGKGFQKENSNEKPLNNDEDPQRKSGDHKIGNAIRAGVLGIKQGVPKPLKLFTPPLIHTNTASKREGSKDDMEVYYSVVWCKVSNKKHKKWEGDGVLIVCGKLTVLKDMDGKQICRGSGYKASEITDMCDGSTLRIGGKEIEVQGKISKDNYLTGKCFSNVGSSSVDDSSQNRHLQIVPPKPFIPHQINTANESNQSRVTLIPRYDPNKEKALVMPKPKNQQKWMNSKAEVIDVVVDPVLSCNLRPHQREGVTFLYECVMGMKPTPGSGAILADEMGLGKTLQCITLIWTMLKQSPFSGSPSIKKVIVITPGSLVKNWCHEFIKWLGSERLIPFAVDSNNRVDEYILHPKAPVMVISYEMFLRCINDIRKVKFDLVICDEAHRLKNAKIKTGEALSSLGIVKRIFLTGTPIQNNLEEFYTLAEMSNPGIFGSLAGFKKVFIEPITRSQQPECNEDERELGANRAVELSRLTSLFCLRRTADINKEYLPPKVEHVVFIRMSQLQLKIYNHLLKSSFVRSCFSASYNGSQHLVCINALKKLCNDPLLIYKSMEEKENSEALLISSHLKSLFPDDYSMIGNSIAHSAKLNVMDKLLQSFYMRKEKTVIISNSTKTLDILQEFCKSLGYICIRLDGQTQLASRQNLVDRFNDKSSNAFIFLLSSKAGGVGLNLTGASKLILYDIDWNPANDMQSMARVWRDGQKREVNIYRFLITGSIEERMYQRQVNKQALSGTVVDSLCTEKVEFSKKDLKDLFTLKNPDACSTHELLQCDCLEKAVGSEDANVTNKDIVRQKNTSMAELMIWEHISNVKDADNIDEGLKSCDNITFMFRCRNN